MGSLRGKLRKVWDISRGRYWSASVMLGADPDIPGICHTRPPLEVLKCTKYTSPTPKRHP